jgi:hypothetical protein
MAFWQRLVYSSAFYNVGPEMRTGRMTNGLFFHSHTRHKIKNNNPRAIIALWHNFSHPGRDLYIFSQRHFQNRFTVGDEYFSGTKFKAGKYTCFIWNKSKNIFKWGRPLALNSEHTSPRLRVAPLFLSYFFPPLEHHLRYGTGIFFYLLASESGDGGEHTQRVQPGSSNVTTHTG